MWANVNSNYQRASVHRWLRWFTTNMSGGRTIENVG